MCVCVIFSLLFAVSQVCVCVLVSLLLAVSQVWFSDEHEWARKESDDTVTVGITEHAQKELGAQE